LQGSKKVPFFPGQVEFLSGQKTFYSHSPNGQIVCQPNKKKEDLDLLRASKIGELLIPRASWNLSFFVISVFGRYFLFFDKWLIPAFRW